MTEKVYEYGFMDADGLVYGPDINGKLYSRRTFGLMAARSDIEVNIDELRREASIRGKKLVRREVTGYEVVPEPRPPLPTGLLAIIREPPSIWGKGIVYVRTGSKGRCWQQMSPFEMRFVGDDHFWSSDFTVLFPGIEAAHGD